MMSAKIQLFFQKRYRLRNFSVGAICLRPTMEVHLDASKIK